MTPPLKAMAPRHLRLRAICGSAPHKGSVPTTAPRQLKGFVPYRLRAHRRLRAGSKAPCLPRLRAEMGPAPIPAPRRCQRHVLMVRCPGMHQHGNTATSEHPPSLHPALQNKARPRSKPARVPTRGAMDKLKTVVFYCKLRRYIVYPILCPDPSG